MEIVRAFWIHAFADDKVFAFLFGNKGTAAVGGGQRSFTEEKRLSEWEKRHHRPCTGAGLWNHCSCIKKALGHRTAGRYSHRGCHIPSTV